MKKLNQFKVILVVLAVMFGFSGFAQSTNVADDEQPILSYDTYAIATEWNAWHETPNAANAFIGEFMTEFNVPQTTVNPGLTLFKTWQWWASHNEAAVEEYISRRDNQ